MKDSFSIRNLRRYLIELEEAERAKKTHRFGTEPEQPTAPLASNIREEDPTEKSEAEEEKLPFAEADGEKSPAENFKDLADSLKDEEGGALREEVGATAEDTTDRGTERSESAAKKNDALYEELAAFIGKQDGRYDGLIDAILKDPAESEIGRALLARYMQAGEDSARHTTAAAAGENGGNLDSYAAAQARRQMLDYQSAGEEAAAEAYGKQLDRVLEALGASTEDLTKLFGLAGDSAELDADLAKTLLGTGESLFSSLLDAQTKAEEIESDRLAEMFDKITDGALLGNISPMQIDEEYYALMSEAGGGHKSREALLILWNKYPTMRAYIANKYDAIANGYIFE